MKIERIVSDAPRPMANYSEGFRVGSWVFAAGQIASDYKTGVPPEARRSSAFPYYGSDIKLQTRYVLENLKKTFAAAGSSFDHVVKARSFTAISAISASSTRFGASIFGYRHHVRRSRRRASSYPARWLRSI